MARLGASAAAVRDYARLLTGFSPPGLAVSAYEARLRLDRLVREAVDGRLELGVAEGLYEPDEVVDAYSAYASYLRDVLADPRGFVPDLFTDAGASR